MGGCSCVLPPNVAKNSHAGDKTTTHQHAQILHNGRAAINRLENPKDLLMTMLDKTDDILAQHDPLHELAERVLSYAQQQGATSAEVAASYSIGLEASVRLGQPETLEYTRDQGIGVTVYKGQSKGSASSSDTSPDALQRMVQAACDIAQYTSPDPHAGLAEASLMAQAIPDLDLYHPWPQEAQQLMQHALECEQVGRDLDPRITNSEGASVSSYRAARLYANSHGFRGYYPSSRHSLSCVLIGQDGDSMQRDYEYTSARAPDALLAPEYVGRSAAERTLRRLHPRSLATQPAPVIFAAEVASSLWGHLLGAIRGSSIYRKSSFLLDKIDSQIFPSWVQLDERPHIPRALGSAPFDGEGVATRAQHFIQDGHLLRYVLNSYAARKLQLQTTANAGGVRNLHVNSTHPDLETLLKNMGTGLLVTELMGQGVNLVTGDYSRGASGFWVENGELQYPVEGITIAGQLAEMFMGIQGIGADYDKRGNIYTGSVLIERMMIAGQ